MATPSSSASMESSPNPSTKSGASTSISAGVMSSSCRTSMISCFISSSSDCMATSFPRKVALQIVGQTTRRESFAGRVSNKGQDINVLFHFDIEIRRTRRQAPPFDPFGKHYRVAPYQHRSNVAQRAHRDIGRAPLEPDRTVYGRARALGKNDQIAAATKRCDTVFNQTYAVIVVADIRRGAHGAMGKRIAPERAFNYAIRPLHKRH